MALTEEALPIRIAGHFVRPELENAVDTSRAHVLQCSHWAASSPAPKPMPVVLKVESVTRPCDGVGQRSGPWHQGLAPPSPSLSGVCQQQLAHDTYRTSLARRGPRS